MDFVPRILTTISAVLFVVGIQFGSAPAAEAPVTSTTTAVATGFPPLSSGTSVPTTTVYTYLSTARCGQWWGLAISVGWQEQDMETLDYIMWRESRCDPAQHNTTLNEDGSYDVGLTQINDRSWCLPTKWYPKGYLQTIGVLTTVGCDELFDPATNLKAALAIHEYHRGQGQEGFEAWGL